MPVEAKDGLRFILTPSDDLDDPFEDQTEWPRLSCPQANQLALEFGELRIEESLTVNNAISTNQLSVIGSVTTPLTIDNSLTVNSAIATQQLSVSGAVTGSLTIENDLTVGGINASGTIQANTLNLPTTGTQIFHNTNESGTPDGDGFRLRYDNNFFGTNQDALVIEKTDGNNLDPDGGIVVVNTGNDGVVETALVIRGNGNVGIGTNSPAQKLDVSGSVNINEDLTVNGSLTTTGSLDLNGDLRLRGADIRDAGNTSRIRINDDGDLSLRASNGLNSLTIAENRNVGIITTNPQARLHIIGGSDAEPGSGGYLVVGNTNGTNLAIDDNEIMARNNGTVSNLHLQASGGNLLIQNKSPGRVGIGISNPVTTLHVRGTKNAAASMANHIAVIENTSSGSSADVLALKIGTISPGGGCNFITFKSGDRDVGSIEGTGDNNIRLKSGSGDYAEYLPRLNEGEVIEPGELVGIFGGKVTKYTQGADQVMAITNQPIVLGKAPEEQEQNLYEQVAFLGQVPIKVRGTVQSGDYIIPSGFNDGIGIAVSPHEITAEQFALIVGRAWENSEQKGVKQINAVVGLNSNSHWLSTLLQKMQMQQSEIKILKNQIQALKSPV
ncbi:MAG: hypothetical protein QNJ72_30865 [Pleurocapsa sp. MO_226.B13]|nr:hypothetical protein [Pleurocapsa sp. MO_226.B13]